MVNAQYVNKVGKLVNNATKFNVDIDNLSVTNIVLIRYLDKLKKAVPTFIWTGELDEFPWTNEEILTKLDKYIHCLKKEMNFYESKVIADSCVLTETDGKIELEDNLNNNNQ